MKMTDNDIRRQTLERGGFETLNAMQEAVLASHARRIILLSPTGSGKTVAFSIFLKRCLQPAGKGLQALVIAPARELAQQIASVLKQQLAGYRSVTLTGGHALRDEVNRLQGAEPDIIVATPGRLLDHLQRGTVDISGVKTAVIDEMDKCLDLGFMPDIKKIIKRMPAVANLMLTSATMPTDAELLKLAGNAELIDFSDKGEAPDIETVRVTSFNKDKIDTLASLLNALPSESKSIVFVNHRESAERVYKQLKERGFPVSLYHGALDQQERELAVAALRGGALPVMVATDLAARGLDIPEVENVIHYHLPVTAETYTHRNGRTARAGASGSVYVINHDEEPLPEYIIPDRDWLPAEDAEEARNKAGKAMIVFNIGKKDKISKGDVLGFLTKDMGLEGNRIGRIEVGQQYSAVTLPVDDAREVLARAVGHRLKNKRFRLTLLS